MTQPDRLGVTGKKRVQTYSCVSVLAGTSDQLIVFAKKFQELEPKLWKSTKKSETSCW